MLKEHIKQNRTLLEPMRLSDESVQKVKTLWLNSKYVTRSIDAASVKVEIDTDSNELLCYFEINEKAVDNLRRFKRKFDLFKYNYFAFMLQNGARRVDGARKCGIGIEFDLTDKAKWKNYIEFIDYCSSQMALVAHSDLRRQRR